MSRRLDKRGVRAVQNLNLPKRFQILLFLVLTLSPRLYNNNNDSGEFRVTMTPDIIMGLLDSTLRNHQTAPQQRHDLQSEPRPVRLSKVALALCALPIHRA